jgi:hypothetical protein
MMVERAEIVTLLGRKLMAPLKGLEFRLALPGIVKPDPNLIA